MKRRTMVYSGIAALAIAAGVTFTTANLHTESEADAGVATTEISGVDREYDATIQNKSEDELKLPDGASWPDFSDNLVEDSSSQTQMRRGAEEGPTLEFETGTGTSQAVMYYLWAWENETVRAHSANDKEALQVAFGKLKDWTTDPLTLQFHQNPESWYSAVVEPALRGDFTEMESEVNAGPPKLPTTPEQAGLL